MAKINVKKPAGPAPRTFEGGLATRTGPETQLRRLTTTAMLWEDGFYVDGKTTAQVIADLVPKARPEFVAAAAFEARTKMKLRHVPLLLVREMARHPEHKALVSRLLPDVIQRADEITEFLAIYWKDGKTPISAQVKKGLARAFNKFGEYALAKYNRDGAVKLRDVAFLTHVKPQDPDLIARLVNKDRIPEFTKGGHRVFEGIPHAKKQFVQNPGLKTPDTWEVELSAGKGEGKLASWQRLLAEKKLGGLAFLRNLRNMTQAGVDTATLAAYAKDMDVSRILPFRFVAAARVVPQLEHILEPLMFKALGDQTKLPGRTVLLVDVSGSMGGPISSKSDLIRLDAAAALAMLLREICEDVVIGRFDDRTELVPPRRGFALRDAIGRPRGGTSLRQAVNWANQQRYDRLIVFTDEQSMDRPEAPTGKGYIVNIAAHQHGVGYGAWHTVNGFSEAIIDYIREYEAQDR